MSVENYLPGDLCSGLIIYWRKSLGEISPGEKFLGEKCDEFLQGTSLKFLHDGRKLRNLNSAFCPNLVFFRARASSKSD